MADPIIVNNVKPKTQQVNVDGNIWTVKLPGSGTQMKYTQVQRRIESLDRKISSETITDDELDKYDELETFAFETLKTMFNDGTDDNASVNKWFDETPLDVIMRVCEEIREKANGREVTPGGS